MKRIQIGSLSISEIRSRVAEKRIQRRLRAGLWFLASALVLTQVIPTIAENVYPIPPELMETSTATIGESPEPTTTEESPSNEESAEPATSDSSESPTASPSPSPSPSPTPPFATGTQDMYVIYPTSVRVDPRATSVFLPRSVLLSSNTLLVCMFSNELRFDLGTVGAIDDGESERALIQGDMTGNLLISGSSTMVNSYMNSELGLRVFTTEGPVGGKLALIRLVDVSKPTLDESLCEQGLLTNHRLLQVIPLGLSQNISKAKVELNKNGRKNP